MKQVKAGEGSMGVYIKSPAKLGLYNLATRVRPQTIFCKTISHGSPEIPHPTLMVKPLSLTFVRLGSCYHCTVPSLLRQ